MYQIFRYPKYIGDDHFITDNFTMYREYKLPFVINEVLLKTTLNKKIKVFMKETSFDSSFMF